ncbi:DNA polymerase epsilon catalytic subunit A [Zancudomyces culisetae]|uniref:DNA polymerase epsilon catalytic subunit A n=1 Tax=Zancudomyces culisetae TaxID=1213189 RepID=A0A1R1PWH3_ZANCU|nr:DNA polymerase epsilon catalytic subunit A [Zancudomyces culisetae]OMH85308.1 DNA polymerase epsilon catalytic subunit A [Zancudomyces culisetae]|eukprot:OMH80188.1 DNA polymerase epsilon catalytic subunit A [Zancudomyces culisetae]
MFVQSNNVGFGKQKQNGFKRPQEKSQTSAGSNPGADEAGDKIKGFSKSGGDDFMDNMDVETGTGDFGREVDETLQLKRKAEVDEMMGFWQFQVGPERLGWLINIQPEGSEIEAEEWIKRKYEESLSKTSIVEKEDLDMANHLLGKSKKCIKLEFDNIKELISVRKSLQAIIARNIEKQKTNRYGEIGTESGATKTQESIVELREYDIPYYQRVAMDKAFDIETTKLPLKFPDATFDMVMMISYMIDGQGYLITNREIVSEDIEDFDYTPKEEFQGPFEMFNEPNEKAVLERFFSEIRKAQPTVVVTYNGDSFDWPFVHARALVHGMDLYSEIGWYRDREDEYKSSYSSHMDCLKWVKRDSYLPVGSQGLKAVTTAKLGYNPMELDPEDMTKFASEKPQTLAQYSVSDAVATYYLYMKYVHPFIFSLCNIIPLNADDVLRKGSGTLCEALLMVEAYKAGVLMPNKHVDPVGRTYDGHLIETETYVGGHVEALEAGIFRSDIPLSFSLDVDGVQQLIDEVDQALKFSIEVEGGFKLSDIENYDEIKGQIKTQLEYLRDHPNIQISPLIYHLDVAAMYPNIILTNRLQPDAVVNEKVCASCDFNVMGKTCERKMKWLWRGEYYPATKGEVNMIKAQIKNTAVSDSNAGDAAQNETKMFLELSEYKQNEILKSKVKEYSRKVYNKIREIKVEEREASICQRETSFYVNTVRNFRDRRYVYKGLLKNEKSTFDKFAKAGQKHEADESKKLMVTYDSLQLAHKCILNSFYGYVMRRGARWHSLEMAGVVCYTGSKIIQLARSRVEKIGRPLELDTDGIWCALPNGFPENYSFKIKNSTKKFMISYPCSMLNHLVHAVFTNDQYQDKVEEEDGSFYYKSHSENSIFFEIDGPYRAMVLPASTQADKLLKKRYAVFNPDGSLAELKGFEVKRRGELKLIKIFQSELFSAFLKGEGLEGSYSSVASVADKWLDILHTKAATLPDEEVFDLLTENRSMSKSLESYGSQKSTAICTAKRLAEFLGDQMVKDAGLACKLVISEKPYGAPVSERAIPIAIFQAEPEIKTFYLKKWLGDSSLTSFDIRDILDWNYYLERFGSVIQKLITIPAASQGVSNPVPRVAHPDWLSNRVFQKANEHRQMKLTNIFAKSKAGSGHDDVPDIESAQFGASSSGKAAFPRYGICKRKLSEDDQDKQKNDLISKYGQITPKLSMLMKREPQEAIKLVQDMISSLEAPPDPFKDYSEFLSKATVKWRYTRVLNKMLKELKMNKSKQYGFGTTNSLKHVGNGNSGLGSYYEYTTSSLARHPWYVIQVSPVPESPGVLKLWALVGGHMHAIQVAVPRIFYVMSTVENRKLEQSKMFAIAPQNTILPREYRNGEQYYLYQCKVSESLYREHGDTWNSFFAHPEIGGVFETQITSLDRALIQLGGIIYLSSKPGLDKRPNEQIDLYDLDNLRSNKAAHTIADKLQDKGVNYNDRHNRFGNISDGYLQTLKDSIEFIFVHYHVLSKAKSNERGMLSVIFASESKGYIWAIDSDSNNATQQLRGIGKYYQERRNASDDLNKQEKAKFFEYPQTIDFEVQVCSTFHKAHTALQAILVKLLNQQQIKHTMVAQYGSKDQFNELLKGVRILENVPSLKVSLPIKDQKLSEDIFNSQKNSARTFVDKFLETSEYIHERMSYAEHSDIPVANITAHDPAMMIGDVSYARELVSNNHVLWWSHSNKPDLGGREADDVGLFSMFNGLTECDVAGINNGLVLNNPGSHQTMCIELEIRNMTINAILQSGVIVNELESNGVVPFGEDGGNQKIRKKVGKRGGEIKVETEPEVEGMNDNDSNDDSEDGDGSEKVLVSDERHSHVTSGTTLPSSTLTVMRQMLREIINKARSQGVSKKTKEYHQMLENSFARWLTQPQSKLYDPVFTLQVFQQFEKKVFWGLINEVQKLGTMVLFASRDKLVLRTNKMANFGGVLAFTKYLLQGIVEKPILANLSIELKTVWGQLIWLDESNFGGITVGGAMQNINKDGFMDSQDRTVEQIEMVWSLKDSLPVGVQEHFEKMVAEFIYECYQFHKSNAATMNSKHRYRSTSYDGGKDSNNDQNEANFVAQSHPGEALFDDSSSSISSFPIEVNSKTQDSSKDRTSSKRYRNNDEFYRYLIGQEYSRKLMEYITMILEDYSVNSNDQFTTFPKLPGIIRQPLVQGGTENSSNNKNGNTGNGIKEMATATTVEKTSNRGRNVVVALEYIKRLMIIYAYEEACNASTTFTVGGNYESILKVLGEHEARQSKKTGGSGGGRLDEYDIIYNYAFNSRVVRRNLLKLIKIGEFSSETFIDDFRISSKTNTFAENNSNAHNGSAMSNKKTGKNHRLVVKQIRCHNCKQSFDLNLTTDASIITEQATVNNPSSIAKGLGSSAAMVATTTTSELPGGGGSGGVKIKCLGCNKVGGYNEIEIQEILIEMIMKQILSYQNKDLICGNCKLAKNDHLNMSCKECNNDNSQDRSNRAGSNNGYGGGGGASGGVNGGKFWKIDSHGNIHDLIELVYSVSRFYNFEMVIRTMDEILH